jgi:hypothetical protein
MIRSKNYLKTQYTGVNSSTSVEQQESPIYRPPSQTVSNQPNFNYSLYPAEDSITSSEAKRSEFLPPLRPRQSSYYEQKLEPFESSHSRNEEYLSQPPSHQHGDRHYKQDQKSDSFHPRDIIPQEYQQLPHYETYPMQPQLTGNWEPDTKDSISSHSVPSTETKRQTTGSMVDHTYRDFSGVPPSSEDLERYENKKGEYNRRIKEKNDVKAKPPAPAPVPPVKAAKDDEKSTSLTKKRGRGNKANRQGKDSFVGFMGTNFPARLHDLLAHENDINDIITWLPHGRSWIVRDKKEFLKRVAPSHFQVRNKTTPPVVMDACYFIHLLIFVPSVRFFRLDFQIRKFHAPSQWLGFQTHHPRSRYEFLLSRTLLARYAPSDSVDEESFSVRAGSKKNQG